MPEDTAKGTGRHIITNTSSYRCAPWFCRMLKLSVATFLVNYVPAVFFKYTNDFADFHMETSTLVNVLSSEGMGFPSSINTSR